MNISVYLFFIVVFLILSDCISVWQYKDCSNKPILQKLYDKEDILVMLQEKQNSKHIEYNREFCVSIADKLGTFKVVILEDEGFEGLVETFGVFYKHKYIINLRVTDFFNFNYNHVLDRNLLFIKENEDLVENITYDIATGKLNETTNKNIKYETRYKIINSVVVASEAVLNNEILSYTDSGISSKTNNNTPNILICNGKRDLVNNKDANIIYAKDDCYDEFKEKANILSIVIAQNYFNNSDKITIPVIFTDAPYILPEYKNNYFEFTDAKLSNAKVSRQLHHEFMEFIEKMGWHRIAIISDTYPHSVDFENNLIPLLIEKRVVYTVQRCEKVWCDLNEELNNLYKAEARVVILNVNEDTAQNMARTRDGIIWLVRDWPFPSKDSDILQGNVFSISTTPMQVNEILDILHNHQPLLLNTGNSRDIQNFKSDLIKNALKKTNIIITKISPSWSEIIANYTPGRIPKYVSAFDGPIPSDSPSCFIRNNDYFKPCDEYGILLYLMVIAVFLVMVFVIFLFFSEISEDDPQ